MKVYESLIAQYTRNEVAGAGAGMVTAICTTPLDVLKTRLMTQGAKKTYSGPLDCLSRILKEEGAAALFKVTLLPLPQQFQAPPPPPPSFLPSEACKRLSGIPESMCQTACAAEWCIIVGVRWRMQVAGDGRGIVCIGNAQLLL